jgi:Flp pilus assembly protein TadG
VQGLTLTSHLVRRRPRAGDDGASLVEFALLLPLFMMLILGMFSGGIAYNRKNSMNNAVREGARYGATLLDDTTNASDWSTPVRTRIQQLSSDDLTLSQICVQLIKMTSSSAFTVVEQAPATCSSAPSIPGGAPSIPAGATTGQCLVRTWAQRTSELQALVFSRNITLTSNAVSRYERDSC